MFIPHTSPRFRCAVALTALTALICHATATAQERLELLTFVNNQSHMVDMDATVTGFGAVRTATAVPNGLAPSSWGFGGPSEIVTIAGGRYLAWVTSGGTGGPLLAFDRRSRTLFNATGILPDIGFGVRLTQPSLVESDSHRPRLFVSGSGFSRAELWALDLQGAPPVRLGTSLGTIPDAAYAAESDELFYLEGVFENTTRVTWVVAVNASTGQELRRFKLTGVVDAIRTDATGRVVWVSHNGLEVLDAATGVVLASSNQFNGENTTVDGARQLLLVRQGDFLVAVDPLLLTEIGRARVTFMPPDPGMLRTAQTLPGRWMTGAYAVRTETRAALVSLGRTGREDRYEFTCNAIAIDARHPNGALRESADLLARLGPGGGVIGTREQGLGCHAFAVLVRSPFAPAALAASVSGRDVTLSWTDPGDTAEFEVEFGFAPGQRAGALRVGRATSFGIPGVAPGVYYVRVKAWNEVGPSPASNEVRLVVP